MSLIFDSHAHYDSAAFDDDRDTVLASLPARGVGGVINAGSDLPSSRTSIALSEQYPFVWAAVGVHPEAAREMTSNDLAEIRQLATSSRVVAIGEIGLDYHYEDACPREIQQQWFAAQLALANKLDLPVIVHDREAHEDTLRLLREYRPKGVLHCFSGSVEMLREVMHLGMSIGLGGAVTFKNARRPVEAAAAVPADRLLLETDAPYMTPVPDRGKRCDSAHIAYTAAKIAEVRGIPVDALLDLTRENTCRLFGIALSGKSG